MTRIEQLYNVMKPFIMPIDMPDFRDEIANSGRICPSDSDCRPSDGRCLTCWNQPIQNEVENFE